MKKKLTFILGLIWFVLAISASFMAWNTINIRRQVNIIELSMEDIHKIGRIRQNHYRQTHSLAHYLLLGEEEGISDFQSSKTEIEDILENLEKSAQPDKKFGAGSDNGYLEYIGTMRKDYATYVDKSAKAIRLKRTEGPARVTAFMERPENALIDYAFLKDMEDAMSVKTTDSARLYDEILFNTGGMPWAAQQNLMHIEAARSALLYYFAVDKLYLAITKQMNELVNFMIAGSEYSKTRFDAYRIGVEDALRECERIIHRQMAAGFKGQEADLKMIETLRTRYHDMLKSSGTVLLARGAGDIKGALLLEEKNLKFMVDNILLSTIDAMIYESREKKIDTANGEMSDFAIRSGLQGVVAILAFGTLAFLTVWRVIRGVVSSFGELRTGTEIISKGDLDHRISVYAEDELGELAGAFNSMAANLKKSHDALQRRLNFEQAVAEISTRFVGMQDINGAIRAALADIGRLSGAGRAYIFLLHEGRPGWRNTHEWCAAGVRPLSDAESEFPPDAFPWWHGKLLNEEMIHIEDVTRMPVEAKREQEELIRRGVNSALVLPVSVRGEHAGFAGFDNVSGPWRWSEDDIALLRMFSEIVGSALERKNAEKKLRRYADELSATNEELKSFAYIISHDLRAPLVNIKGFSGELRRSITEAAGIINDLIAGCDERERGQISGIFQKDVPEALGFIESSVTRMDNLINSILTLSRIGRRELKPEAIGMNEFAHSVLDSLAHQVEEKKATVTVGELPNITADRTAMEQILGNLLDNAIKYLEPARPGIIDITGEQSPDEIVFRIRDNGRGMAKEDISRAFEVFKRVGKQDVAGEGMGLAYVKALIKRFGGRIWCESELGKGSTLSFSIPRMRERA